MFWNLAVKPQLHAENSSNLNSSQISVIFGQCCKNYIKTYINRNKAKWSLTQDSRTLPSTLKHGSKRCSRHKAGHSWVKYKQENLVFLLKDIWIQKQPSYWGDSFHLCRTRLHISLFHLSRPDPRTDGSRTELGVTFVQSKQTHQITKNAENVYTACPVSKFKAAPSAMSTLGPELLMFLCPYSS